MNSNINYIKTTENCTGNNPWANDTKDVVQEGIDHNKLNGYESANHSPLQEGDDIPVKAPEWIIHLTGMNKNDMRIIFSWLLLDPPSPSDSEETAIRSLMADAKYFHGDDDLHDRLELIISRTPTMEDIITKITNWKGDQIPRHIQCMCGICLSNQKYIDCINSFVEINWNNDPFKDVRVINKTVKLGTVAVANMLGYSEPEEFLNKVRRINKKIKIWIAEIVADDHVENSEPE